MKQTTANTAPINQGLHTFRGALQRLSLTLLLMLLTTASAWAKEYIVTYQAKFSPWGNGLYEIILQRSGNSSLKATIAEKSSAWLKNTGVCVNDEYDVTFMPSQNLFLAVTPNTTTATGFIMSSGTFTASVANSNYYIKQVKLLNNATTMGTSAATAPNSRSAQVSVSGSSIQFNYIEVTLTDDYYGTITPQNGLTVGIDATLTDNGTKYYKNGTTIKMNAPTNYIIDEASGVSGTSIAADKRSYTFTMPKQNVTPGATASEVHTISTPSGLTVTTNPYFTSNTTKYYKKDQTYTLTVDDANKVIQSFTASGASGSSVASGKRSATVTIGTSNVTVSATLLTITGSCGTGLTWSMSDTDSNGTYDLLTLSGSGTLSTSPWDTDFSSSISRVDVSSADITISGNPFSKLGSSVVIVVPTPAYAVSYASAGFASKLRVQFGNYLFSATNEGGTPAYAIATKDDLNNLSAAVNAGNDGNGLTFRQTADIYYNHTKDWDDDSSTENNFTAIGYYQSIDDYCAFCGTYDGQGHKISGIRIYKYGGHTTDGYQGLFRQTGSGATIQGITLADASITGYDRTGGIVGLNDGGTVSDCHVAADVTIHAISKGSQSHGGIVGQNTGTVSNCTSAATLTNIWSKGNNDQGYGGIVGYNDHGSLIHNLAIGAVVPKAYNNYYGAICGQENGGTFENNYYYHCTVAGTENATGVGCDNADFTNDNGAVPAYLVTLGNNVTATPTIDTDGANGISYDSDGDHQAENYYRNGIKLTLASDLSEKIGYHITYKASYNSGNKTLDGNTYTVNGTDGDVTLTAQLTITDYTITYDLDGGSVATANPTTYNVETPTFTLNNPTKPGYTFIGWTEGNDNTRMPTVTITKGSSTKDLNYTANYEFAQITQGDLSFVCTSGTEAKITACDPGATSVTIPATVSNNDGTYNVTAIDASAFSSCTDLLCLILNSETPLALGDNAFSACTALNAIGVPAGTAEAYKTNWSDYAEKIYVIDGKCGDNVYYTYDNDTKTLNIFGTGAMEDYSNSSNRPWFSYLANITTVVIGNGVTSIGFEAFGHCTSLNSITIPDGVTSIGFYAFGHCTSLNSITIPDGVTSIGNSAFTYCTGLTSIEIPACVTTISSWAFDNCTSLKSVTIYAPKRTTYAYNAFDHNADGRKIYVPSEYVESYKSGWSNYASDIVGFDGKCGPNVYYTYDNDTKTLNIFGTGAMEDYSNSSNRPWFSYLANITTVVIGNGVTSIGDYAFNRCTSLESITIPDGVTSIDYDAFGHCTSLNNINIPDGVTSIDNSAFTYCTGLTSIEIPASVTTIRGWAFDHCTSLKSVTIYAPMRTTYAYNAFNHNADGRKIYVPSEYVESYKRGWSDYASDIVGFDGKCGDNVYCTHDNDTKTLRIFGTGDMEGYGDGNNRPWYSYYNDIKTLVIDNGVTSIGELAFDNCKSLTSIEIPASVTTIYYSAFQYCTSLTSIVIANGVTTIDNGAFSYCTGLTSIEIPASVTSIGYCAFMGCTSLNSINIPDGVTSIGTEVFKNCTSLTSIEISANVTSIGDGAFEGCNSLESIEIPANVTSIGSDAFYNCPGLKSLTIPVSLTIIGENAFYGCTGLESISVAAGNTKYDSRNKCNALIETRTNTLILGCNKTVIPDDVKIIDDYAFLGCTGLISIEIPASVTSIGSGAFKGCTGLGSISVAAENTKYDSRNNCNALIETETNTLIQGCNNTVIPGGVMSIGDDAFYLCTGLTGIEIPASVTTIGETAFYGCTGLTSIEIPAGMTDIGNDAFSGCSGLTSVTIYAPSLTTYGNNAFASNGEGRKIYVFSNSLATYKEHAYDMEVFENDIEAITDINLRDNDDNRSLVEAANDNALGALNVTLQGRKLYKDGAWNTLCLPFDVTIKESVLDGDDVKAMVLDDKTSGLNGDELTLNFVDAPATIPAGTPFIIKWKQAAILENPAFTGVTINKTAPEVAFNGGWFEGTYRPVNWAVEDQSILFLGDANTLYYPKAGAHLNAFRAYFLLEDPNGTAREIVVNFGEETTGVVSMHNSECLMLNKADAWYTVNGVKLDGKPTAKGMYIHGGRKVVIK